MPTPSFNPIFEDQHLMILSKAAGLLSQGDASGEICLVDQLREYFGRNYVGLVHRLDRNVSGLMVIGKRTKAANRLSESIRKRELKRTYLGWVEGRIDNTQTWEHRIERYRTQVGYKTRESSDPDAKPAVLRASPLRLGKLKNTEVSLVSFELLTGRSHQIRSQCEIAGHPLLGDSKYSGMEILSRPALHSFKLECPHPMERRILKVTDSVPKDLASFDSLVQWERPPDEPSLYLSSPSLEWEDQQ